MRIITPDVEKISLELATELALSERRSTAPQHMPIRFSRLKEASRSMQHYRHAMQSGREETLAMRIGTGTHAIVFGTPNVVVYSKRRSGKEWDAFAASHSGDVILNEREYAIAKAMAESLTRDFVAYPILFSPGTQHEIEVQWKIDGRDCAGRIDSLGPMALCDLKTTKDADPRWFPFSARREHWHVQATWYADGCEAAGLGWRHPHLVVVESAPPYAVTVWRLPRSTIREARNVYRGWFSAVLECEKTNRWPGYSNDVLDFYLPGHFENDEEMSIADDATDDGQSE